MFVAVLLTAGWLSAAPGQNSIPSEKRPLLGKQMAADFEQRVQLLNDQEVSGYVGRIAEKLARAAGLDSATAKVVNTPGGRAEVFPSGFVYLDSGLILSSATSRDLAGTLAHLIAHSANPQRVTGVATIPLIFAGCSRFGPTMAPRSLQGFEQEADRLGQQYMQAAGYDKSVPDPQFDRIKDLVRAALAPPQPPSLKKPTLRR